MSDSMWWYDDFAKINSSDYYSDENVLFASAASDTIPVPARNDKEKTLAVLQLVGGLASGIPTVGPVIEGVSQVFTFLVSSVSDGETKGTKEEEKVRDVENEMKTLILQVQVNSARVFAQSYTDLLQDWHKAGRFTMNTNADRKTMEVSSRTKRQS